MSEVIELDGITYSGRRSLEETISGRQGNTSQERSDDQIEENGETDSQITRENAEQNTMNAREEIATGRSGKTYKDILAEQSNKRMWIPPLLTAGALAILNLGVLLQAHYKWNFGIGEEYKVFILDIWFGAIALTLVAAAKRILVWWASKRLAHGGSKGLQRSTFVAIVAQTASVPWAQHFRGFFILTLVLSSFQTAFIATYKFSIQDTVVTVNDKNGNITMLGLGASDGISDVLTSNDLFINMSKSFIKRNEAMKYAGSYDKLFIMPMWPRFGSFLPDNEQGKKSPMFGDVTIPSALSVTYNLSCIHGSIDVARIVENDTTNLVFYDKGKAAMQATVITNGTSPTHNYYIEFLYPSPKLYTNCSINFGHAQSDVTWTSNSTGMSLTSVGRPKIFNGIWNNDIYTPLTKLWLTYENTIVWYLTDYFVGLKDEQLYQQACNRLAHTYAQTVLMRTSLPGSTIHDKYEAANVVISERQIQHGILMAYAVTLAVLSGIMIVLLVAMGTLFKPIYTGDLLQSLAIINKGAEIFQGFCASEWKRFSKKYRFQDDFLTAKVKLSIDKEYSTTHITHSDSGKIHQDVEIKHILLVSSDDLDQNFKDNDTILA
ncbi:hypothetical protein HK096_004756 [Nowakowskiella sp. JEL0078]|nr:hypothetical protein HK096_004756 [Nowakowskiella sp. JEL0078]